MPVTTLDADLERLSLADMPPSEALATLRQLVDAEPDGFPQRAYVALKAATLKRLTARRSDDLGAWADLIRRASAFAEGRGEQALAERLLALADLTADWKLISDKHDIRKVLERPYVRKILDVIWQAGGELKRAEVRERTGIGEAYLSRILSTLEAIGLITRDNRRSRTITLTAEAARLVSADKLEKRPVKASPVEDLLGLWRNFDPSLPVEEWAFPVERGRNWNLAVQVKRGAGGNPVVHIHQFGDSPLSEVEIVARRLQSFFTSVRKSTEFGLFFLEDQTGRRGKARDDL